MPKRILRGTVIVDSNDKSVSVLVERRYSHPLLRKTVRRTKKYAAHDEDNRFKVGDLVAIEECAPVSKRKRWVVVTHDPSS